MNVIEKYKEQTVEQIREDLREKSIPVALMMSQVEGDFNISTMIRNANAFGAREVFYYGRKKFDKRGAVGTYHFSDVKFLREKEEILELKKRYHFVALDIIQGESIPMEEYQWKENTLMLFGEEQNGLKGWEIDLCDDVVHISQFGSVPSLNVGTASGIALYDFSKKITQRILRW